jgi:hypothetical protein
MQYFSFTLKFCDIGKLNIRNAVESNNSGYANSYVELFASGR